MTSKTAPIGATTMTTGKKDKRATFAPGTKFGNKKEKTDKDGVVATVEVGTNNGKNNETIQDRQEGQ